LVFDHATPAAVAAHLRTLLAPPDGAERLLGDLDRLETALAALPAEDIERHHVTGRLRALLTAAETTATDGGPIGEDATVDEIFDFIDNQLGLNG
jgi:hypothetical protein